ncbi:MAG: tyrosine--tRNA ligase [Chthoniobacterales bacterium]|nr:tyrosine--tRNA ligase [Chthoniobacterales bacterium]
MDPAEAFSRLKIGAAQIISEAELRQKLSLGRPLRVKLGVDPTSADLHLGHTLLLQKLRQFQELGHEAILIIGDFTAMIGDPSGRSAARPQLAHEQVLANAESYRAQAFQILDPQRTRIVSNGDWFKPMLFAEVIRLNSRVTLQQLLQREDFKGRVEAQQPIRAHEIQYPIMQGWDSVQVQADVELGGTDQLFNILVGRDLQKEEGQAQQVVFLMPILEGLDGVQKMSKSLGNYVGIKESPNEMFGKLMSISDALMARYYPLLLGRELSAEPHPMAAKKKLAQEIVATYHSAAAGRQARADWERRFSEKRLDEAALPEFAPAGDERNIVSLVVAAYRDVFSLTKSRGDVRRLVDQGSVQLRGEKLRNVQAALTLQPGDVLRLDKTRAVRIK